MSSTDTEMSSESSPPSLEELSIRGVRSLLLPFIVSFASAAAPSQDPREVIVFVNPRSGSITFIEGPFNLDSILRKEGPSPASKASIEAMPVVPIAEEGLECAICLTDFEVGEGAKEMPCKHRFHSGCIEKWLGIQGSCPVCRYKMPLEEDEDNKKGQVGVGEGEGESDGEGEGGRGRRGEGGFVFHVFFGRGGGRNLGSDSILDSDSDSDSDGNSDSATENGRSTREMEVDRN